MEGEKEKGLIYICTQIRARGIPAASIPPLRYYQATGVPYRNVSELTVNHKKPPCLIRIMHMYYIT